MKPLNWAMNPARWLLPALLTLSVTARAQASPNCALTNIVDDGAYATLTLSQWSEADQDSASYNWAWCRAARLKKELTAFPRLNARIDGLRQQYREMRALESQLAGVRAGGGTMYSHAVPRMYPHLEDQLRSLSALTRSPLGARTGQLYGQKIAQATASHIAYVATLRAYKPGPDEQYSVYDPQAWKTAVDRYEALGRAVMATLGAATTPPRCWATAFWTARRSGPTTCLELQARGPVRSGMLPTGPGSADEVYSRPRAASSATSII